MIPYYSKLDLELDTDDWRFLNYLNHTHLHETKPFKMSNGEFSPDYRDYFISSGKVDYRSNKIFKKICNLFTEDSPHSSIDYVYRYSQISYVPGKLITHRDRRSCAISIPLVTLDVPIRWYDDNDNYLGVEYFYEHAVSLINTSIRHGAPNNVSPRIFFQVGGFNEDFNITKSKIKSS
jgi:hypothetical protein